MKAKDVLESRHAEEIVTVLIKLATESGGGRGFDIRTHGGQSSSLIDRKYDEEVPGTRGHSFEALSAVSAAIEGGR